MIIFRYVQSLACFVFLLHCTAGTEAQDLSYVYNFLCDNSGSQGNYITSLTNGDILFAGHYHGSMDIDPGDGVKIVKSATGTNGDIFIVRLDSTGALKSYEVSNNPARDYIRYLGSDPWDNIYTVCKFPASGTIEIKKSATYTKVIRTPNYKEDDVNIVKIAFDNYQNAYVLGNTVRDFVVDGTDSVFVNGTKNNFLLKYDPNGTLIYSLLLDSGNTSSSSIDIYDIEIGKNNDIYFGGRILGSPTFHASSGDTSLINTSKTDQLYGKLDADGNLLWLKSFGGNPAYSYRIVNIGLDSSDHVIIASDQDATIGKFVYKCDADGNRIWTIKIGSRGFAHRLHVLPDGAFYFMSRYYQSCDMDPNLQAYYPATIQFAQYYGHFVAKYNSDGEVIWGKRLYAASAGGGVGPFAVDKNENIHFGGTLNYWLNYDTPSGIQRIEAADAHLSSAFLFKWTPEICAANEKVDYYIPNSAVDDGNEIPPIVDHVPWDNPSMYRSSSLPNFQAKWNNSPTGDGRNYAVVKIQNRGCADSISANTEIRFALQTSDLTWPAGWENNYIQVGSEMVKQAGLVSNIKIPKLLRNDVWYARPIFNELPDPRLFGDPNMTMNVLARIKSDLDPMSQMETNNIIFNVMQNNNIAWKIFNVTW